MDYFIREDHSGKKIARGNRGMDVFDSVVGKLCFSFE